MTKEQFLSFSDSGLTLPQEEVVELKKSDKSLIIGIPKEIKSLQSLNKQLMPKDVSSMVLYLASEVSSGCTKQNFIVDAGIT